MSKLNPGIHKMDIGTRELREVTIYPLSMKDQLDIPELISKAFEQLAEAEELKKESPSEAVSSGFKDDVSVVTDMIDAIKDNVEDILVRITDEKDEVNLENLTNDQFLDLVTIIFEVNYESATGKLKALMGKVRAMIPQQQAQPVAPPQEAQ